MINAKLELLEQLSSFDISENSIKKIAVKYISDHIVLKKVTQIDDLDFEYDDITGEQYIHGYILLNNGNWFERTYYKGHEWWELKETITEDLINDWMIINA